MVIELVINLAFIHMVNILRTESLQKLEGNQFILSNLTKLFEQKEFGY